MPGKSEKSKFLSLFSDICVNDLFMLEVFGVESDETKQKQEDIFENLAIVLAAAECCRYFSPFIHNSVPKNRSFINCVVPNLDESRFKQIARVNRSSFGFILNLIKDDVVFDGAKSGKQHPIELQLLLVLYRLGSSGEAATYTKIASLFGVGDGGTIQTITNRVFSAILKHRREFLFWPNALERNQLKAETRNELPFCVGFVDGTEIKLAERPTEDPESYFSRKHIYSVKMQCICDHKLRVRHLVAGFPGSVHDARVYNTCELSTNPSKYFSENEWIAGDSAYKLTATVITPFKVNSSNESQEKRYAFNKKFSKYRIRIEHCFGLMKERFNSLKELRLQLKNDDCMRKICQWVLVCAILHNITIQQKDKDDLFMLNMNYCNTGDADEQSISTTSEGEEKRRLIMQLMGI